MLEFNIYIINLMKLNIFIALFFISILSSSYIMASRNKVISRRRRSIISVGPTFDIEYFLINLVSTSGFPIADQLANILTALKAYDERGISVSIKGYKCSFTGLKQFYSEKLNDTKFQSIFSTMSTTGDDPIKRCREIKAKYKLYSPAYDQLKQFLSDTRSDKVKHHDLVKGRYDKMLAYIMQDPDAKMIKTWIFSYSKTLMGNINIWVMKKISTLPPTDQFKILKEFFVQKKCKSLSKTSLFQKVKNKIAAGTACIDYIQVCGNDGKLQLDLAMIGYNISRQVLTILSDVVTGGISRLLKSIGYVGMALHSLVNSYLAYKSKNGKDMSIHLGKAAGFAIHIAKVLLLGKRKLKRFK